MVESPGELAVAFSACTVTADLNQAVFDDWLFIVLTGLWV